MNFPDGIFIGLTIGWLAGCIFGHWWWCEAHRLIAGESKMELSNKPEQIQARIIISALSSFLSTNAEMAIELRRRAETNCLKDVLADRLPQLLELAQTALSQMVALSVAIPANRDWIRDETHRL